MLYGPLHPIDKRIQGAVTVSVTMEHLMWSIIAQCTTHLEYAIVHIVESIKHCNRYPKCRNSTNEIIFLHFINIIFYLCFIISYSMIVMRQMLRFATGILCLRRFRYRPLSKSCENQFIRLDNWIVYWIFNNFINWAYQCMPFWWIFTQPIRNNCHRARYYNGSSLTVHCCSVLLVLKRRIRPSLIMGHRSQPTVVLYC